MKFDYKTNFKINEKRQLHINKKIKNRDFCINKDGIIVSNEYPENERNNKQYNNYYRNKKKEEKHISKNKIKNKPYYNIALKLFNKYCFDMTKNILEIGAGNGCFAKRFIKKFKPKIYDVYESSFFACEMIKKKLIIINEETEINICIRNFKKVNNLEKYGCVIALDVLEHINDDIKFLEKFKENTWVLMSLPTSLNIKHVRSFLTPDSIAYRYRNILRMYQIIEQSKKNKYPKRYIVMAKKNKGEK